MANKHRGVVTITLDKERTLRFTLNTLVEVEEKLGFPLTQLGENMSIKVMRTLLHAGLKHEDETLTEEVVGEMITLENIAEVQEALSVALGGSKN